MPKEQNQIMMKKFVPSYNTIFCISKITIIATAKIAQNTIHFSPQYCANCLVRENLELFKKPEPGTRESKVESTTNT